MKSHRKSYIPLLSNGRALWLDDELCNVSRDELWYPDDKLDCPFCRSDGHGADYCVLNPLNVSLNSMQRRIMLCYCMWSNSASYPRHILPYEYPMKATVINIDHKNNVLYVRAHYLDELSKIIDHLCQVEITQSVMEPTKYISVGKVYVVYRRAVGRFARAVCSHLRYKFQSITHWQMYLIDLGVTEFVEQADIYPLTAELGVFPPMGLPLVLTDCHCNSSSLSSCKNDHFRQLSVGSTCIFVISSTYGGRPILVRGDGGYPTAVRSSFPPPVLSRVFYTDASNSEILCSESNRPRMLSSMGADNEDIELRSWMSHEPYMPGTFQFLSPTFDSRFPVRLLVQVTEKIDTNVYWFRDESVRIFVDSCIVHPSNSLSPYIREGRTLACLANILLPSEAAAKFYRAMASGFNLEECSCSVFLIDYGVWLKCNICNLFDLMEQPSSVLHTPGAAFRCRVGGVSFDNTPLTGAVKLAVDEKYVIDVLSVDHDGLFFAKMQLSHPQHGMQSLYASGRCESNWPYPERCSNQPYYVDGQRVAHSVRMADYASVTSGCWVNNEGRTVSHHCANKMRSSQNTSDFTFDPAVQQQYNLRSECAEVIALLKASNAKSDERFRCLSHKLDLILQSCKLNKMQSQFTSGSVMPTPYPVRQSCDLSDLTAAVVPCDSGTQLNLNNVVLRLVSLRMERSGSGPCSPNMGAQEIQPEIPTRAFPFLSMPCAQELHPCPDRRLSVLSTGCNQNEFAQPVHSRVAYVRHPTCSYLMNTAEDDSIAFSSISGVRSSTISPVIPSERMTAKCSSAHSANTTMASTLTSSADIYHSVKDSCSSSEVRCSQSFSISVDNDTELHVSLAQHGIPSLISASSGQSGVTKAEQAIIRERSVGGPERTHEAPCDATTPLNSASAARNATNGECFGTKRKWNSVQGAGESKSCEGSEAYLDKEQFPESSGASKVRGICAQRRIITHGSVEVVGEGDGDLASEFSKEGSTALSRRRNSNSSLSSGLSCKNLVTTNYTAKLMNSALRSTGMVSRGIDSKQNLISNGSGARWETAFDTLERMRSNWPLKSPFQPFRHGAIAQGALSRWNQAAKTYHRKKLDSDAKGFSCWICGKAGEPTDYCAEAPTPDEAKSLREILLAKSIASSLKVPEREDNSLICPIEKGASEKEGVSSVDGKSHRRSKVILYTSDESSSEEGEEGSNSDKSFLDFLDHNVDAALMPPNSQGLKYRAWTRCIEVKLGSEYTVERCDDYINNSLWPLFFVHIFNEHNDHILRNELSSLRVSTPLPPSLTKVGKLCVVCCGDLESKCRAVITAVEELVEVFYIDYGKYDWVSPRCLWCIEEQPPNVRTRPSMAIPCILSDYCVRVEADRDVCDEEEDRLKVMVGFDQTPLRAKFIAQRDDGVYIVHIVSAAQR